MMFSFEMRVFFLVFLILSSSLSGLARAGGRVSPPDALVYQGPGACDEGCSDAAALVAQKAGMHVIFVGPAEKDFTVFNHAVVWIQPGGHSRTVGESMTAELKDRIREFVRGGGAYVGFCAGGFFATEKIGDLDAPGLGILPGKTVLYEGTPDDAVILPVMWSGKLRQLYWEGGPFFSGAPGVEVTATYSDGTAASVRSEFGAGRVYVTGGHPEAPQFWRDYYKLKDADGLDYDLAVDMIKWAARRYRFKH